jgi:cytochrome c1
MFPNDAEHLARWIAEPDKQKPGTLMLNLSLPPDQVTAMVAYLQSLK